LSQDPFAAAFPHEDPVLLRAVEKWGADTSRAGGDLLAAVCYNHVAHGEIEDRAFFELEKRGEQGRYLLRCLLNEGQFTCTFKGAAFALARMGDRESFARLAELLRQDNGMMFPMDIAGALGVLGDPRAVPLLASVLPAAPPSREHRGDSTEALLAAMAHNDKGARIRAALGLGCFTLPDARAALEKATEDPSLKSFCAAALYRAYGESAWIDAVQSGIRQLDGLELYLLTDYLEKMKRPEVEALVAEGQKRLEEEEKEMRREYLPSSKAETAGSGSDSTRAK
jgi:HEAT repeat protein